MSFLLGLLQSLIASIIFNFYGVERKTRDKKAFEKRAKQFHKNISPYLLNTIIPRLAPELKSFFYKLSYKEASTLLPFIN